MTPLAHVLTVPHGSHPVTDSPPTPLTTAPSTDRVVLLGVVLVISVGACAVALLTGAVRPDTIQTLVAGGGAWAMVAYVLVVILAELLWMPRMWGLLAGGVLFGPVLGAALSVLADTIAAVLCFGIARSTGRAFVTRLLEKRPSASRVVHMLAEKRGAATIALLRVCPIAHYTLVSYAAGLAGVPTRSFLLGSTLGILPGAILYPIVGDAALQPTSPVFLVSTAILVVFLVFTVLAARRTLGSEITATSGRTRKRSPG